MVCHIMWRLKKSAEENERSYPKWKTSLGSDCIFISTDLITAGMGQVAWGEFNLARKRGGKTSKVLEEHEVKGRQTSEEGAYEIETKGMEKS